MSEYLSLEEAAHALDIPVQSVRALCEAGEINGAIEAGQDWRIPRARVESTEDKRDLVKQAEQLGKKPAVFFPRIIIAGLALILGLLIGGEWLLEKLAPKDLPVALCTPAESDEIVILMTPFYHANNIPGSGIHNLIREALQEEYLTLTVNGVITNLENFRVDLSRDVLEVNDVRIPQVLDECKPTLMITGSVFSLYIDARFHSFNEVHLGDSILLRETEKTPITVPNDPGPFSVYMIEELPQQLSMLAFFAIGELLIAEENYVEAMRVMDHLIFPVDAPRIRTDSKLNEFLLAAFVNLGLLYEVTGDSAIAARSCETKLDCFEKAVEIELNEASEGAYFNRAYAYSQIGLMVESVADYSRVLEINEFNAAARSNRASAQKLQGNISQAREDAERAVELDQTKPQIYSILADVLFEVGEYEKAIEHYTKAIDLDSEYLVAYYNRGLTYYELNDFNAALRDFTDVIEQDEEFVLAYKNRGDTFHELGDVESAIDDLQKAIELDPSYALAYNNLGYIYYLRQNFESAEEFYNQAISVDEKSYFAHHNLGILYRDRGEIENAIEEFSTALSINEDQPETLLERSVTYFAVQELSRAEVDIRKAIELDPDYGEAFAVRGFIEWQLNQDTTNARLDFDKAVSLDLENGTVYAYRASFLVSQGEMDDASKDFAKAFTLMPETALGFPCQIDTTSSTLESDIRKCFQNLRSEE